MASLFTLMPAGAGPIPLERLEAAADTEDVLVDCLIDEELYWLRTGTADVDPVYDEPYLSGLAAEARRSAIDSGLRALMAKGMVDVDPDDTSAVKVLGVYGLLSECRSQARSVTRVLLEVRDEAPIRYAFHRISDTLVLVEEVSEDGFHDFTFQSLDSAAASLSSIFDRRRTAGAESGRHIRGSSAEDLEPSPEGLRAAAAHVVTLTSKGTAVDGGTRELAMTVFGMADGVWAHWVEPQPRRVHVMAQAGSPDLFVLAADAIAGRTSSR
ncbi:MAG TPA: hypothetical protein VMS74_08130 [Acidimicrobiia bacterium]|nr:hypothetical protein [Acidimicrobiia bacterium]